MKYTFGTKVKAISNYNQIPHFTVGKEYKISAIDVINKTYLFLGDNSRSVECDQLEFEVSTEAINEILAVRIVENCTCGAASVGVKELDRHSYYCDLKNKKQEGVSFKHGWPWS